MLYFSGPGPLSGHYGESPREQKYAPEELAQFCNQTRFKGRFQLPASLWWTDRCSPEVPTPAEILGSPNTGAPTEHPHPTTHRRATIYQVLEEAAVTGLGVEAG